MDNKVAAMLKAGSDSYKNAEPDVGAGFQGEWPAEGAHDVLVLTMKVGTSTHRMGRTDTGINCVTVQFQYEVQPDTNAADYNPDKPNLVFWGREFSIIPDPAAIDASALSGEVKDKVKNGSGRDMGRLRGHISKILLRDPTECVDLGADLAALEAEVSGRSIAVHLKVTGYRPEGKNITYYTDYVTDNIG